MNLDSVDVVKIVWLSGPSSSGKTTITKMLEEKGWMRIEADAESADVEVAVLKTVLLEKFDYLRILSYTSDN